MKTFLDFTEPAQPGKPRLQRSFGRPQRILQAHCPADVPAVLQAVQQAAEQGWWCVGWLAYEAASAFDSGYENAVHEALSGQPLAWFGVYREPRLASNQLCR